jgi:hypothetical protein
MFGGENCMLDSVIATTILMFDIQNFRKFLRLSPNWHFLILDGMDDIFKNIEN